MEITDGELLSKLGTNGSAWTEAFLHSMRHNAINHIDLSEDADLIFGWFVNAIEAGRNAGRNASKDYATNVGVKEQPETQPSWFTRVQALDFAIRSAAGQAWDETHTLRVAAEYENRLLTGLSDEPND
jgi:hypothetical protein